MPADPYKYFRIEARELVDELGRTLLELERGASTETVARLLRVAHTLKGAARVVKQPGIADRAHALEDGLAPYRTSTEVVPSDRIDALLRLVDEMNRQLASLDAPRAPEPALAERKPADEPARVLHANATEMDELLDGVTELHAHLATTRRALADVERAKHMSALIAEQFTSARRTVRSDDKARALAEDLSSLLIRFERTLSSGVDQADRELAQVRRSAEQMRLTPASTMFVAVERTARDDARALRKRIVFEGRGGDVRLDSRVLAVVQAALLQVVRNAIAHGIEPEDERAASGKPREGRVTIQVVRRGRFVAFLGIDDGRGVDLEGIRTLAERRGLMSPELRAQGTDGLLHLLLEGGLSTSTTVTEVSGRGVGLDVVRETAERLSGKVAIRTQPRQGTTIELVVPVSVASMPGLGVEAAGITATIPLDAVLRTMRVDAADLSAADAGTVVYDGTAVPFLPLARAMFARHASPRTARAWSTVIVRGREGIAAIGVDRLLGTSNVVLRPLPELAPASDVVAGASLDAAGNPRLVLDPDALVLAARDGRGIELAPEVRRAPILVIDDSLTTRMLERSILESAGYEVDVATSGEEGLEKARQKTYGLFLVDIEMPGMDGFSFVERTRADPALHSIPAILVSSRSSAEDRRRGEEAGALDYMIKSEFNQGALLERIRQQVG